MGQWTKYVTCATPSRCKLLPPDHQGDLKPSQAKKLSKKLSAKEKTVRGSGKLFPDYTLMLKLDRVANNP